MTTTQKFVAPIVVILYLALLLLGEDTLAFSVGPGAAKKPTTSPLSASLEPSASEDGSRRSFLTSSVLAVLSAASVAPTLVVCADDGVDDLSMPSEEEQKMAEAERLRVKAELQKKNAKPATFKDSFAAEKEKQKALQKTKEERRNALCEELGRGC